jgi:hypothetical protein
MPQGAIDWPSPHQQAIRDQFATGGYTGLLLSGNRDNLESWLERSLAWFARYPWMQRQSHQKTDRVLNYQASPAIASYLGAAPNRNRWVRMNAVSYVGLSGDDFAALVWDQGVNRLRVAIYNFRSEPIAGGLRLERLDHGRYLVRQGLDADDDGRIDQPPAGEERTLRRDDVLALSLPPRAVTVVQIEQIQKLDDIRLRADLALSPRGVKVTGSQIAGQVHNIGSRDAAEVVIAVIDADGREVARQSLGALPAPLDLQPRSLPFQLTMTSAIKPGWRLVVDPQDQVAEITEINNTIALGAHGDSR